MCAALSITLAGSTNHPIAKSRPELKKSSNELKAGGGAHHADSPRMPHIIVHATRTAHT